MWTSVSENEIHKASTEQALSLQVMISFLKHLLNSHHTLWELHGASVCWELNPDFTQAQKVKKEAVGGREQSQFGHVPASEPLVSADSSRPQHCLLYNAHKGSICDVDICSLGAIFFLWELDKGKLFPQNRSLNKHFRHSNLKLQFWSDLRQLFTIVTVTLQCIKELRIRPLGSVILFMTLGSLNQQ